MNVFCGRSSHHVGYLWALVAAAVYIALIPVSVHNFLQCLYYFLSCGLLNVNFFVGATVSIGVPLQ